MKTFDIEIVNGQKFEYRSLNNSYMYQFTAIFKLKLAKQAAQHRHYYRITLPKSRKRSQLNSAAMSLPLRSEQ